MTTLQSNPTTPEPPLETTEAYLELRAQIGRKSPELPPDLLVRHVLDLVPASEWPTRVAALDAILRRQESARRERLRVVDKPEGGRMLGLYTTKRRGASVRPYRTVIRGIDPMDTRCDCPDFVKNGLGVCKHALAVLAVIHAKPRRIQLATREQEAARVEPPAGLSWDPIRPLTGFGDWLDRVSWRGSTELRGARAAA
ncbi:MAG: SWIM zinc finger family protein, partial [Isosphaeraceae bacterium]